MDDSRIFLTDEEFAQLFGEAISRVTRVLAETAESKCLVCKGKCCLEIGCGLYSGKFSFCPIYELRPRECRFHFCHKILNEVALAQEDREILEMPVKDLLRDEAGRGSKLFPLFPQFPLDSEGLTGLGIQEEVSRVIKAFENSELDENQAKDLLKSLCLNTDR